MAPDEAKRLAKEYLEKAVAVQRRFGYSGRIPADVYRRATKELSVQFRRLAEATKT